MAVILGSQLNLNAKYNLDSRKNPVDYNGLLNWDFAKKAIPNGFEVYCITDKKFYTYDEANVANLTTGKFVKRDGKEEGDAEIKEVILENIDIMNSAVTATPQPLLDIDGNQVNLADYPELENLWITFGVEDYKTVIIKQSALAGMDEHVGFISIVGSSYNKVVDISSYFTYTSLLPADSKKEYLVELIWTRGADTVSYTKVLHTPEIPEQNVDILNFGPLEETYGSTLVSRIATSVDFNQYNLSMGAKVLALKFNIIDGIGEYEAMSFNSSNSNYGSTSEFFVRKRNNEVVKVVIDISSDNGGYYEYVATLVESAAQKVTSVNNKMPNADGVVTLLPSDLGLGDSVIEVAYVGGTGTFTFTHVDGSVTNIDTNIEKIVESGSYDAATEEIVLVTTDGSEIRIPAAALVDIYNGVDGDEIQIVVSADKNISAILKNGTIDKEKFTAELQEELKEMYDEIFPAIPSFSSSSTLQLVGSTPTINLSWSLTKKGELVTPTTITLNGNAVTGTTAAVNPTSTTTYTLVQTYDGVPYTSTVVVNFNNNSYFGVTTKDGALVEADITSLSTKLLTSLETENSYTGTEAYRVYAYPASYGDVTKITDGTFDYTSDYTKTVISISGVNYNVYKSELKVNLTNYKQIFS